MIGDVIDTFRVTTPAFNRKFVRKSRIETSYSHSASNWNIDSVHHAFLCFAILQPHVKELNSEQIGNEQYTTNSISYSRH